MSEARAPESSAAPIGTSRTALLAQYAAQVERDVSLTEEQRCVCILGLACTLLPMPCRQADTRETVSDDSASARRKQ